MNANSIRMSWRNLWRNRRRTLLSLAAIGVATGVIVFFIGIQISSYDTVIRATTGTLTGELQIQHSAYQLSPRLEYAIDSPKQIEATLRKSQFVRSLSSRASAFALVSSNSRSYGVGISGVDPQSEPNVSTIPKQIRSGRYLHSGGEAVVGKALAENLRVGVGDELTLLGQGRDGSVAATLVTVVGVFESGIQELDRNALQIPLPFFQESFSMADGVHSIVIRTKSLADVQKLQSSLELPNEVVALRWDQLVPGVREAIDLDLAAGWLFYFSLIVIVTFGITNTMLMSVIERTREFGTLLALGAYPQTVFRMVLLEATFLSILGIALGIVSATLLLLYYSSVGFSIPGSEAVTKLWNLPNKIHPQLSLRILTEGPKIILLTTLLGALYPALQAARLNPLKALQGRQ